MLTVRVVWHVCLDHDSINHTMRARTETGEVYEHKQKNLTALKAMALCTRIKRRGNEINPDHWEYLGKETPTPEKPFSWDRMKEGWEEQQRRKAERLKQVTVISKTNA